MSAYQKLLRHPMWQRKRLEIFQRDDFTCTHCTDDEFELHVHHLKYINGRKPWEYPNDQLVTLCCNCHDLYHRVWDNPGIVVYWAYVLEDQIGPVGWIPWTGRRIDRGETLDHEYICVGKNKKEEVFSGSCSVGVFRPDFDSIEKADKWLIRTVSEIAGACYEDYRHPVMP